MPKDSKLIVTWRQHNTVEDITVAKEEDKTAHRNNKNTSNAVTGLNLTKGPGIKLPVPLPQSLHGVSGELWLGGETFPPLCVC